MRKIITAKLIHTKWGLFAEFNDELISLEIPSHLSWQDFELNVEQEFEVFYTLSFAKSPTKANKEWVIFKADTLEEIEKHHYFKQYNLSLSEAYPRVSLK